MGDASSAIELFGSAQAPMRPLSVGQAFASRAGVSEQFGTRIPGQLAEIIKSASASRETDPEKLHGFINAFIGIFRAFETVLPEHDPVKRAMWNQKLAQGLFFARGTAQTESNARAFVQVIQAMNDAQSQLGIAMNQILTGARAQAGLMHLFDEAGFEIRMLDCDNGQEIKEWDVRGGTDFIAIDRSRRLIYYIDAKSKTERPSAWNKPSHYDKVALPQEKEYARYHLTITLRFDTMDELGTIEGNVGAQMLHSLSIFAT